MEKEKINRINALAKKAKEEGLDDAEKAEQHALRQEYIAAVKRSLTNTLEHTSVQYPDGRKEPLNKKKDE